MIWRLVRMRKPARVIAPAVSRAGWQPPATAGQTPLWSSVCKSTCLGPRAGITCS